LDTICPLKNRVKTYAWGSRTFIQELLGQRDEPGAPMAELWLGTHPEGPSEAWVGGEWLSLERLISRDPDAILGKGIARRFSRQLPFLFKVLAMDQPLSLQVHPDEKLAFKGFSKEEKKGIPAEAPERIYRDPHHKPEIVCALTPFEGLTGMRTAAEIIRLLETLAPKSLDRELHLLRGSPNTQGVGRLLDTLLSSDRDRKGRIIREAAGRASRTDAAGNWILELHERYPDDIFVLAPVLLNYVSLAPGEALYLSPRDPHAYLGGAAIELMANSDNVLRGGLTDKHVDVKAFLNAVRLEPTSPARLKMVRAEPCRFIYNTPCREFRLSVIATGSDEGYVSPEIRSIEILICLEGSAAIRDLEKGKTIELRRGRSVMVPASVRHYDVKGRARLFTASVPLAG
jgi:mannose-6-phosphate isomerase